ISGVYEQMLLEDLVNDFYIVLPGETFELPTKLTNIKMLRSVVKILKYVIESIIEMEIYKEVNDTLDQLNYVHNPFNDLFKANGVEQSSHYKLNFIYNPWWTPKKNISSRMLTAFEEMENKKE
ncbi:12645_t:CDS:2, partial [Funneliformis caledonium]